MNDGLIDELTIVLASAIHAAMMLECIGKPQADTTPEAVVAALRSAVGPLWKRADIKVAYDEANKIVTLSGPRDVLAEFIHDARIDGVLSP